MKSKVISALVIFGCLLMCFGLFVVPALMGKSERTQLKVSVHLDAEWVSTDSNVVFFDEAIEIVSVSYIPSASRVLVTARRGLLTRSLTTFAIDVKSNTEDILWMPRPAEEIRKLAGRQ